jgi:hypothetical protein
MAKQSIFTSAFLLFATLAVTNVGCSFYGCSQYNARFKETLAESDRTAHVYDIGPSDAPIGIKIKRLDRFAEGPNNNVWWPGDKVDRESGKKSTDNKGYHDPERYKPMFLDIPGFTVTYENLDSRRVPYYLHIYVIDKDEMDLSQVTAKIQGQLQAEFPEVDNTWPPIESAVDQAPAIVKQAFSGDMFFDNLDGGATTSPGTAEIYVHQGDERAVVFVARVATRADEAAKFPWDDLTESLTRLEVGPAPEKDAEEEDAKSTDPVGEDTGDDTTTPTGDDSGESSGNGSKSNQSATEMKLLTLASMKYHAEKSKGPSDWSSFLTWASSNAPDSVAAMQSLKDAGVVFFCEQSIQRATSGTSRSIFAYYPSVPESGGVVALMDGSVKEMSAQEFNGMLASQRQFDPGNVAKKSN